MFAYVKLYEHASIIIRVMKSKLSLADTHCLSHSLLLTEIDVMHQGRDLSEDDESTHA